METVAKVILAGYVLIIVIAIVTIVYLIFVKVKKRKSENFEKRDN